MLTHTEQVAIMKTLRERAAVYMPTGAVIEDFGEDEFTVVKSCDESEVVIQVKAMKVGEIRVRASWDSDWKTAEEARCAIDTYSKMLDLADYLEMKRDELVRAVAAV